MTTAITKRGFFEEIQPVLAPMAARTYDQRAFMNSAMMAVDYDPKLQDAIKDEHGRKSMIRALKYAAVSGLSLNPAEGKAALVVYNSKGADGKYHPNVQYQIMKNGKIELVMDSGQVKFLTCDIVKDNDHFRVRKSMDGDSFEFEPAIKDRGETIGFFAAIKLHNGSSGVKYMTIEEIKQVRDTYARRNAYNKEGEQLTESAWMKSFDGMGLKTVIKRLLENFKIGSGVYERAEAAEEASWFIRDEHADEAEVSTVEVKGTTSADVIEDLKEPESKPDHVDGDAF